MNGICIGLGVRGKMWFDWAKQAGMNVVGVVDLDRALLDAGCNELGVPADQRFERITDAARQTGATVATICTPNHAHAACVRDCLESGLHCIVEKPMVEDEAALAEILALSRHADRRVAVAQQYRYTPPMLAMRDAVRSGRIGRVNTINLFFARWRPAGDMILPLMLNQAVHQFDAVRSILGRDPQWCGAHSWNPGWSPTKNHTMLEATYGFGDSICHYSGNYVAKGAQTPYSGRWRIEGDEGSIEYHGDGEDQDLVLTRHDPPDRESIAMTAHDVSESALVCRDFLEAVTDGTIPPTDATDNAYTLGMAFAAVRSSETRRIVTMDEVPALAGLRN
ncbi:MAG: hypothetical protein CMJ18_24160 [Phycisphaeraceae bacterium]|nr:hypothetical protein [Phycisphaeraceae bacterium]